MPVAESYPARLIYGNLPRDISASHKSTNHLHSPPLNKKRHDGRIQGSLDCHLTAILTYADGPAAIYDAQKPPAYDGILIRGHLSLA